MAGRVHYHTMHHKLFSVVGSGGVKGVDALVGNPWKFRESVIIGGVNEGELSAGKRDATDGLVAEFKIPARIEVGAGLFQEDGPPPAGAVGFLHTHQGRAVGAH